MNDQFIIDPNVDLYGILDVAPEATAEEIKMAYKRMAMRWHPDRPAGNAEKFREGSEAYAILSHADNRAYYDRLRDELRRQSGKRFSARPLPGDRAMFDGEDGHRTLREIIVDSLNMFQETLHKEIPKKALHDFGHACRWVFDTWREIKDQQEAEQAFENTIEFGAFTITREQVERQERHCLKGRRK